MAWVNKPKKIRTEQKMLIDSVYGLLIGGGYRLLIQTKSAWLNRNKNSGVWTNKNKS
jgi:hypothetical protein